jgi:hypothetical protein
VLLDVTETVYLSRLTCLRSPDFATCYVLGGVKVVSEGPVADRGSYRFQLFLFRYLQGVLKWQDPDGSKSPASLTSSSGPVDRRRGIDWCWQAVDTKMSAAPLGGEGTVPNPTDLGKSGTERHLLVDGGASRWRSI